MSTRPGGREARRQGNSRRSLGARSSGPREGPQAGRLRHQRLRPRTLSPEKLRELRLGNLKPGGHPHQKSWRRYLVHRLPPEAQRIVHSGLARGDTYRKIRADLEAVGTKISKEALSNYWRNVWKQVHEDLEKGRLILAMLKESFQMDPESDSAKVAEELLYTILMNKKDEMKGAGAFELLDKAREQTRVTGKKAGPGRARKPENPAEQAREIRRRWRQLYGLEGSAETEPAE